MHTDINLDWLVLKIYGRKAKLWMSLKKTISHDTYLSQRMKIFLLKVKAHFRN